MATLTHAESRRLYSWWWDSHISPKNSKWLQENLTHMDVKVKAMLKLIEEDADSFARRAEMYYKKRPELIKLVEEFYRAYRALAERYDHATGALRQAHRTIAEAFPNQIPLALADDSPIGSSAAEAEPHTPEMAHPIRAIFDPDDLQKDALGVSSHFHGIKMNGGYSEDNVSVTGKIGLKQLNEMFASGDSTNHARFAEGKVRKGLKFQGDEKKGIDNLAFNASKDIQKHNVAEIDDSASKTRSLQDELSQLSTTNENLKIKVESESRRADQAKDEVEGLQKILSKLESEKEAAVLQFRQCLERVSSLEAEISRRQADVNTLNGEIVDGATRLNATEERLHLLEKENQSLQAEVDSLSQKATMQLQEIQHKNGELEKLGNCIEEERMHLMHAEGALQSLQSLHSQSQEQQKILALELQHGVQMLKDMDFRRQGLEEELQRLIGENNQLNEQNLSSAMSIKSLQDEIYSLREAKERLEEEVMLRVDERNALQQELYCLKEELNDLDRKHRAAIEQVESVGFDASRLRSSIEKLQDENRKLKELCKDNEHEKAVLLEKLENMDKLIEKNTLLENSLSDASVELEGLRERLSTLEKSLQSLEEEKFTLVSEKSVLISQVENMTQNMEKLTKKNSILENSLSEMHSELDGLKAKAQSLQESCQVLCNEKSSLLIERSGLVSQVETVQQCLDHLEGKHAELEYKHSCLEKERESALCSMNELQRSLDIEKQERATYNFLSQTQFATLENQLNLLQKESERRKLQLEEGQDNLVNAEIQIFVLQRSIQDMRAKNLSLSMECLEHIEASVRAKKLILELEREMLEQKMMTNSLLEKNKKLSAGVYCVLKSLDIDMSNQLGDGDVGEALFPLILGEVKAMHNSIMDMEDEKHQLLFEKIVSATLLEQLRLDASDLKSAKHAIEWEFASKDREVLVLQNENFELLELSDHLRQNVYDSNQKVEHLTDQVEHLQVQLSDSWECYWTLQKNMHEENHALKEEINGLRMENHILEEENAGALEELTNLGYLSLVFGSICSDKVIELMRLSKELDHLHKVSGELEEVRLMAEKLEAENHSLKDSIATLEKFRSHALCLEDELQTIRLAREQLNHEIDVGKMFLSQKEMELLQACQKVKALDYERAELIDEALELRLKNEQLSSILHEKGNEVELWEEEATALYEDLQISSICLELSEENAGKLIRYCRNIEENAKIQEVKFHDDRAKSSADNEDLKEKICALEKENGGLKAEWTSFMPLILSLKDSVSSLEAQTLSLAKLHEIDSQEAQHVAENNVLDMDGNQRGPAHESTSPAGEELLRLQTQVQAVEKAVMEMARVAMQRSSNTDARLEAAFKEIEELKSKSSLVREDIVHSSRDVIHQADILRQTDKKRPNGIEQQEPGVSIAKHGLLMKDIQLDHVSETSSLENGIDACGIGKRGKSEGDENMLELWETAERCCRVEPLGMDKTDKLTTVFDDVIEYHEIEPVEEQKSEYPSSELQIEKELAIDKLEMPKRVLEPRPDGNRRVLERLASDALRLANLQASAQELKRRFEKFEKVNQLVGFEYDTVKQQLKEVNEAISQLVNNNGRLTKSMEIIYASDSKTEDFEEARSMRRRQVSQRARRWSEKIARLELEVQRIQFVMLKLENECQNKGMRAFDRRKKVVLRDYLYGVRESRRRKKVQLCACVRPSTKSD